MNRKLYPLLIVLLLLASCGYQRIQSSQKGSPSPPYSLENVRFGFDRVSVRSRDIPKLNANLDWLKGNENEIVILEGHCDSTGSSKYNMDLGDRRARWVKTYLIKHGVNPCKLITISYGESKPLDEEKGPGSLSKNRRVVFRRGR